MPGRDVPGVRLASLTFSPLGQLQGRNPPPPASVIEVKRAELRLDEPVPARFAAWMGDVMQGDFGSTITGQPITDELGRRIGVSLRLFALGTVVGIAVGVLVGVASAIRQYPPATTRRPCSPFWCCPPRGS